MAARIEATSPAPRVFVMRNSSAERDRADAHAIDTPSLKLANFEMDEVAG